MGLRGVMGAVGIKQSFVREVKGKKDCQSGGLKGCEEMFEAQRGKGGVRGDRE